MIKIGYQGVKGSYNCKAAEQFAKKEGFIDFELVPLISSQNVVNALNASNIEYGVIAFQNSIAGTVKESYDAIAVESFEHYDTIINQINHCTFSRKGIDPKSIRKIISHEMALRSTGRIDFSGTVNMQWEKENKLDKIMSLSARYYGDKTNDRGSVNYHRITKQEFDRIKNFDYM